MAAGGGGFGWKCDRGNGGLWPANNDGDDEERLDVLLSSSLLVCRYSSFSLKYAILMYEMLGFFLLFIEIFVSVGSSKWFSFV